jgi:hypothetical protein
MPYHKHYALVALMLALSAQHVSLAKTSYDQLVVADVITLRNNEVGALKRLAAFMVDQHLEAPQGLKVIYNLLLNSQYTIPLHDLTKAITEINTLEVGPTSRKIIQEIASPLEGIFFKTEQSIRTPDIGLTLYGPTNNNIGIGDVNIGVSLTTGSDNTAVGGNSLVATTTGSQNTALGYGSLEDNLEGYNNTAIGFEALSNNTGGTENTGLGNSALHNNVTGDYNTALGSNSLYSNLTGNENTAIGNSASYNNTDGNHNIAIGSFTLHCNELGSNNIAVGVNALRHNTNNNNTAIGSNTLKANTSGRSNVAVGNQALIENTTGANNTGVGAQALAANVDGNHNSAFGVIALGSNTDGIRNTAVGISSLAANTSGDDNTGIGCNALRLSTGEQNVAIGSASLISLASGNSNTAIGFAAGAALSDGNNNIFIGYDAGSPFTNGNNNIFIGYDAGNSFEGTEGSISSITSGDNNVVIGNASSRQFYLPGIGNNSAYAESVDGNNALLTIDVISGQLGLDSPSSRRYKEGICDMGDASSKLLDLRPVSFVYKNQLDQTQVQYGLIAEEVDLVLPELVGYKHGIPERVSYHKLPPLLLNEYQRQEKRLRMVEAKADTLDGIIERLNRVEEKLQSINK